MMKSFPNMLVLLFSLCGLASTGEFLKIAESVGQCFPNSICMKGHAFPLLPAYFGTKEVVTAKCQENPECTGFLYYNTGKYGSLCDQDYYPATRTLGNVGVYELCHVKVVPDESSEDACFPDSICNQDNIMRGTAFFETTEVLTAMCQEDPECTGFHYLNHAKHGYLCSQWSYPGTRVMSSNGDYELCRVKGPGNGVEKEDETSGDDDENEDETSGDNDEKEDETSGDDGEDKNEGDEEDNEDELEYGVIVKAKKTNMTCKTNAKCLVSFQVNNEDGKRVKKNSFESVKICKLEMGERMNCKQAKFKRKEFRLRLGDKKRTPSSAAGEWICIVKKDGKEYISDPTVTVTMK